MNSVQRGFTLVEILAAVAVLAIALAAIVSGMARYADSASRLKEKTIALWVAHNRLTDVELEPQWPDLGDSNGDAELAGVEWRWQMNVKETPDPQVRRITVEVRLKGADADESPLVTLAGFLSSSGRGS